MRSNVSLGPRGLSYQGHLVFSYCVHILQKCRVGALALKLWFYVPTYQLRLDLSVHGKSVAKVAYRTENTNDDIFLHDIGQKRPSWAFIFLQV